MERPTVSPERRALLTRLVQVLRKKSPADPALEARRLKARKKARKVTRASRRANRGTS